MTRITITTNVNQLLAQLDRVARKQVPYASAVALTRTAQDARDAVRDSLGQYFTVRRPAFLRNGIIAMSASKKDWPAQQSTVAVRDEFMARQELGGEKRAKAGGSVAQPIAARATPTAITTPANWPGALLGGKGGKRKFFLGKIAKGPRAGMMAVMRRTSKDRYPLQVLYLLKPKVDVPKRWDFRGVVERRARVVYATRFVEALQRAISTAR